MHLTGDADRGNGELDPRGGQVLPQGRHRQAEGLLPVGRSLLVALWPQASHHLVARLPRAEDF